MHVLLSLVKVCLRSFAMPLDRRNNATGSLSNKLSGAPTGSYDCFLLWSMQIFPGSPFASKPTAKQKWTPGMASFTME